VRLRFVPRDLQVVAPMARLYVRDGVNVAPARGQGGTETAKSRPRFSILSPPAYIRET
jgi:hypothetical protein